MTKKVYFVRHGQSIGNVDGVFHGSEVRLTSHGEQQGRLVAKRCANLDFEVIVSSTMERAMATAGFIRELTDKPIEYSDDIVERIEPAEIRGKNGSDPVVDLISRKWSETFFKADLRYADGENYSDIFERTRRFLDSLVGRKEERIIVVTHGFFMRMVIAYLTMHDRLTPEAFECFVAGWRTTNTGITYIQSVGNDIWAPWMGDRKWVIRSWNDYAHLGEYHSGE
jgi:broad specificity phosphatase PhoE